MKRLLLLTVFLAAASTVLIASTGTASAVEPDACGTAQVDVPDRGASFDFYFACAAHDNCIAEASGVLARSRCDEQFRRDMNAWCDENWSRVDPRRSQCKIVATTYYFGVRLGSIFSIFTPAR